MRINAFIIVLPLYIFGVSGESSALSNSTQYFLSGTRILSGGGARVSANFSLRQTRIGAAVSGQSASAGFTMNTAVAGCGLIPSQPVLDALTSPTNLNPYPLSGKKGAHTGIYINGFIAAPLDEQTVWQCQHPLNAGANTLLITARNAMGLESAAVDVAITLDPGLNVEEIVIADNAADTGAAVDSASVVNAASGDGVTVEIGAASGAGGAAAESASAEDTGVHANGHVPRIMDIYPPGGSTRLTNAGPVNFFTSAVDEDGDSLLYQYSVDGKVKSAWRGNGEFIWDIAGGRPGVRVIKVEVRDNAGGITAVEIEYCLFCPPPLPI